MERGHLVGVTGNYSCVIRITPPLIITKVKIDELVVILRKGIEAAMAELRAEGLWQGWSTPWRTRRVWRVAI